MAFGKKVLCRVVANARLMAEFIEIRPLLEIWLTIDIHGCTTLRRFSSIPLLRFHDDCVGVNCIQYRR